LLGWVDRVVTVKSSISLSDDQHAFARALVDSGRFPSVSAVLQQGIDLLRQQDADAQADRAALRALLAERAGGPFVSAGELRKRLATRRA
jgi:antitoxin ParD1/3/4